MNDFEYLITSSPDREKLSCEIYFKGDVLAEISQESNDLLLEIYSAKSNWWQIPLEDFIKSLNYAKEHLCGNFDSDKE